MTVTLESIEAALNDGARVWVHNRMLVEDPGVDLATDRALAGQTTPAEYLDRSCAPDVRVVCTNTDLAAVTWLSFLVGDWFHCPPRCDRCAALRTPSATTLVRCGATLVQLFMCDGCRDELGPGVIWLQ